MLLLTILWVLLLVYRITWKEKDVTYKCWYIRNNGNNSLFEVEILDIVLVLLFVIKKVIWIMNESIILINSRIKMERLIIPIVR